MTAVGRLLAVTAHQNHPLTGKIHRRLKDPLQTVKI
jgi:hypothetical protein